MAPAQPPCPSCGQPAPEGAATCPRDGTPLPAPSSPRAEDGSPTPLFVKLAIVGPLMFAFSVGSALWIWQRQVPPDRLDAPIHPPSAFNGTLLLTRIERLEQELKELKEAGTEPKGAREELQVLRIRSETAADPMDQRRITDALDQWEQRYLPR